MTVELGDDQLLAAHVAGDAQAFTVLVRRHQNRLWAVALRTLADREEAADALQDALLSAFRNAASYRGEAAVTTWLHRIVVNACLDRIRRRQARPTTPLTTWEPADASDQHASTEARLDVRTALARLPHDQRVALVLVDLEELSVAEVADLLGVPTGTVKSRCSRGRLALAQWLRSGALGPGVDARDLASAGPHARNQDAGRRVASTTTSATDRPDDPRARPRTRPTGPPRGGVR